MVTRLSFLRGALKLLTLETFSMKRGKCFLLDPKAVPNMVKGRNHTCPDNPLCCPDNLLSEKLCCLWTAITGVTMSQFLIRGEIYNSWPKCS